AGPGAAGAFRSNSGYVAVSQRTMTGCLEARRSRQAPLPRSSSAMPASAQNACQRSTSAGAVATRVRIEKGPRLRSPRRRLRRGPGGRLEDEAALEQGQRQARSDTVVGHRGTAAGLCLGPGRELSTQGLPVERRQCGRGHTGEGPGVLADEGLPAWDVDDASDV